MAMVDAFVGALSVILILVILAQPNQEQSDQRPQADLVLRCEGEGRSYRLIDPARLADGGDGGSTIETDIARADLVARLTPHLPRENLHVRIVVEAPPVHLTCATRAIQALELANNDRSQPDSTLDHPIFVAALRAVDEETSP